MGPISNNDDPLKDNTDNPKDKPLEYNIMPIDFDKLISEENNEVIQNMHKYFKSIPPRKNEYTGKYKGYNLIFITAEAFSTYAVRQDITPTLYKMVNEGYKFTNFYNPLWGVSTSDGNMWLVQAYYLKVVYGASINLPTIICPLPWVIS